MAGGFSAPPESYTENGKTPQLSDGFSTEAGQVRGAAACRATRYHGRGAHSNICQQTRPLHQKAKCQDQTALRDGVNGQCYCDSTCRILSTAGYAGSGGGDSGLLIGESRRKRLEKWWSHPLSKERNSTLLCK